MKAIRNKKLCLWLLFFLFATLAGCTVNNNPVNLQVFLNRLSKSYNELEHLITAWAYLTGMMFGCYALFQLKIYGEMRTMMSGHANIFRPLMYLVVCVALMYLPSTLGTMMMTTFGTSSATPLSWSDVDEVGVHGYKLAITPALLGLVRLVGIVAFIRGWILLTRITEQGQHNFGKAATHIIGGVLLINIVGVGNMLWNLVSDG